MTPRRPARVRFQRGLPGSTIAPREEGSAAGWRPPDLREAARQGGAEWREQQGRGRRRGRLRLVSSARLGRVGKGIQAISISVSIRPGRTRELILDLTLELSPQDDAPSEARVARALEAGIRAARDAGWDPESRGRAFRFEIGASV